MLLLFILGVVALGLGLVIIDKSWASSLEERLGIALTFGGGSLAIGIGVPWLAHISLLLTIFVLTVAAAIGTFIYIRNDGN